MVLKLISPSDGHTLQPDTSFKDSLHPGTKGRHCVKVSDNTGGEMREKKTPVALEKKKLQQCPQAQQPVLPTTHLNKR